MRLSNPANRHCSGSLKVVVLKRQSALHATSLLKTQQESKLKYKTLDHRNRPWASGKYRGFLGQYKKHSCGLFMDPWIGRKDSKAIAEAFARIPKQIARLARAHELTVSTAAMPWTTAGNSSTIYADWTNSNPKLLSPHVEFGRRSMDTLLVPHFTHEVSHLYWRTSPLERRLRYIEFLKNTMKLGDVEVTEYSNDHFQSYIRYVSHEDTTRNRADRKTVTDHYLNDWVEESFCETVACLRDSAYPAYPWASTVDMERRRAAIAGIFGLRVGTLACG